MIFAAFLVNSMIWLIVDHVQNKLDAKLTKFEENPDLDTLIP